MSFVAIVIGHEGSAPRFAKIVRKRKPPCSCIRTIALSLYKNKEATPLLLRHKAHEMGFMIVHEAFEHYRLK